MAGGFVINLASLLSDEVVRNASMFLSERIQQVREFRGLSSDPREPNPASFTNWYFRPFQLDAFDMPYAVGEPWSIEPFQIDVSEY